MPRNGGRRTGRRGGAGAERRGPLCVGDVKIYGPYRHRCGFQVIIRGPAGESGRTFVTEEEALRGILDLVAAAKAAEPVTIDHAVDAYLDALRAKGRRDGTILDADYRLRPLARFVDTVQELKPEHVRRRMAGEGRSDHAALRRRAAGKEPREPSVAYLRGLLSRLRDFCRFCIGEGWLGRDPTAKIVVEGVANRGKIALTPAEARALAGVLLADSGPSSTALLCALWLGLRHAEIIKARVRALDLDGEPATWHVERETTKTPRGVRTLELPPLLAARLGALINDRPFDAIVFAPEDEDVEVRSTTWLRKALTTSCKRAEVTRVTVHGLRDTWAQLARSHGAAVDAVFRALGHEEQTTTIRSYIGEAGEEAARAADVVRLHAPAGTRRG